MLMDIVPLMYFVALLPFSLSQGLRFHLPAQSFLVTFQRKFANIYKTNVTYFAHRILGNSFFTLLLADFSLLMGLIYTVCFMYKLPYCEETNS